QLDEKQSKEWFPPSGIPSTPGTDATRLTHSLPATRDEPEPSTTDLLPLLTLSARPVPPLRHERASLFFSLCPGAVLRREENIPEVTRARALGHARPIFLVSIAGTLENQFHSTQY